MPIISGTIPKLTDGVSQQAVTLRLNTAVEEQTNAWLSVVTGNQKRPPSRIIKRVINYNVSPPLTGGVATTIIERFDGKRFIVCVQNGSIRVFDAYTGNEKTVDTPDGVGYLTSSSETNYDFVTVADTTFICNKSQVVDVDPIDDGAARRDPNLWWSIFVKEAIPNSNYAVYINNTLAANYLTQTNIDSSTVLERTSAIAEGLRSQLNTGSTTAGVVVALTPPAGFVGTQINKKHNTITYNATGGSGSGLQIRVIESNRRVASWQIVSRGAGYVVGDVVTISGSKLGTFSFTVAAIGVGYTASRTGSVVNIRLDETDTVKLSDGDGFSSMTVYGMDIENFSKLPPQDLVGRIVRVKGDAGEEGDDYWVIFQDNLWRETWGWGGHAKLNNATMPHVLVYDDETDSFSFERHTWADRIVGDDDTNPHPSFINQTITSMTLHRGRMVLLSGENVILSEADNYENFYRSTVIQLLDNEVIDIAAVTGRQANLFHAVPWNKKLLCFSDKTQFVLDSGQALSPKTASLNVSSSYDCSKSVKPIAIDSSVYFTEDTGTWAKLYEYKISGDGVTEQADLASVQVPEYIKGPIRRMVAVPKSSVIFILGQDSKKLYVYKFMDSPQGKIQSAWNTWTFKNDIKALNVSGNNLYMLVDGLDGLFLETILIEDDAVRVATDLTVYLDDQIPLSVTTRTYDSEEDVTTITLPYEYDVTTVDLLNKTGISLLGFYPQFNAVNTTTLLVQGDWRSVDGVVGNRYIHSTTFSPFVLREVKSNTTAAIQDGLLSIRYMSINYEDTAHFKISVRHKSKVSEDQEFQGFVFGEEPSIIGTVPLASGEFRFPVFEDGRYVEITLTNDSPFHSCFTSAEWQGQWNPKAKQRF